MRIYTMTQSSCMMHGSTLEAANDLHYTVGTQFHLTLDEAAKV